MRRKKKARHRAPSGWDSHHIIFTRRDHDRGYKLLLRRSFIYEIPIAVHQELHANVEPVPPLSEDEARALWVELQRVDYEMELFEALEWLVAHAPNSAFKQSIAEQQRFLLDNL